MCIGAARSNCNLGVGVYFGGVRELNFFRERLTQRHVALHWNILVKPLSHGFVHKRNEIFAHFVVRKTLSQVNSVVFRRQCTHHCKNGSAYVGKFRMNLQNKMDLSLPINKNTKPFENARSLMMKRPGKASEWLF